MLLAIKFGVGCKTGVLSSRIESSRIALVFADLVAYLGISNTDIKLTHLRLDKLLIFVSTQLSEFIINFNIKLLCKSFQFDYSNVIDF